MKCVRCVMHQMRHPEEGVAEAVTIYGGDALCAEHLREAVPPSLIPPNMEE